MTSDEFGDIEQLDENLRKWFKEKWVRFGPDGKIRGACARGDDSEGKPKCLPQSKAHSIGKKGRKYAGAKKRREDPNPERTGKAKNVATKKKTNEGVPFDECPKCRGPIVHESMMTEKQDACYHKVKSRYKVWPSAYASGALVQCRKKGASNWGTGGKKNENNVVKGMVNEEYVLTLYIDGKPSSKYGVDQEARQEMELLKKKFPNKHFELKREVRGEVGGNQKVSEGVIISTTDNNDPRNPQVAVLGGAGSYSFENLKKKALGEAKQLAADIANGEYKNSAYNVKQLANTLNTIVAAEEEMEKLYFGEDYTGEFAAEVAPAINPYGGLKDKKFRGAIGEALLSEMPDTSGPIGVQPGGWRTYKPRPAGEIDEAKKSEFRQRAEREQLETLEKINNSNLPHWAKEYLTLLNDPKGKVFKAAYYSFGKGQDARKEAAEYIMQKYKIPQEWITKVNRLKGMHVVVDKAEDRHYNWDVPSMHEEEQLDELKCWSGYTRVKGVPAGAPGSCKKKTKESSILKGLRSKD